MIIAISILIIPYGFIDYFEQTVSYGCAKTSFWIFFVLLNAFYCGALTMFFSSEISIPFISIEDVIREYPYWKLKMLNGNDVHFQYKAIQVLKIKYSIKYSVYVLRHYNLKREIHFMLNFGTEFKTNLKKLYLIALKKVKLISKLDTITSLTYLLFSYLLSLPFFNSQAWAYCYKNKLLYIVALEC